MSWHVHSGSWLSVAADHALVATRARAPSWLAATHLPLTPDGSVATRTTLQTVAHDEIFAVGDCSGILGYRRDKAGVFAVRQGPILARFREEDLKGIVIDLQASHFWDITAINALDRVVLKFRHHEIPVEIVGINQATATMIERLAIHDKEGAVLSTGGH